MSTDPYEESGQLDRIETKVNEIHVQLSVMLGLFNDHEEKIKELQTKYEQMTSTSKQASGWRFGVPVNMLFSVVAFALAITVFFG